jgi:K+-transporting ATPase ATPase A chain
MTINGFLQIAVYIIILVLLVKPPGQYQAHVYPGDHTYIDPV